MRAIHLVTVAIAATALSCGGSSSSTTTMTGPPPPPTNGVNITVQDFHYSPAVDTIKVGTTVQWVNNGPSEHSSVSDDGLWNSGGLTPPSGGNYHASGTTFQFTFTQTGTFTYHCSFHPPSSYPTFVGKIVVTN
jgi:plastocyanin